MESVGERYRRLFERGSSTDRMVFFTDAVFAIALTLLVIDVRVPVGASSSWDALVDQLPAIFAYVLSFYVIAVNWMGHHRRFAYVRQFDSRLLILNFLLLFVVAFVPFPTSMIADFPGEVTSVVLYSAVVATLSTLQEVTWGYAFKHGHVDRTVDVAVFRLMRRSILVVPVVFVIAIVIALLWDPWIAMWSWGLLFPGGALVWRIGARSTERIENPAAYGADADAKPAGDAAQDVSSDDSPPSAPGTSLK